MPCGTLVFEIEDEEMIERRKFITDLEMNNTSFIAAKGGAEGKGNKNHPFMD